MAGIRDLMGLYYWLDNDQDFLLEASLNDFPDGLLPGAPDQPREILPPSKPGGSALPPSQR